MGNWNLNGWRAAFLAAGLALAASLASAQETSPRALQRASRLEELQQIELDSRYRANPNIPPEQRAVVDFGGYVTFNYLSLDDQVADNHVLRQYDFVAYTRVMLDNANEFFLRFRTGYRDFNDQDSFDGKGDEIIDPDLDRLYYRFDLAASQAAYHGKQIDTDIAIKGGRDLAYWANGLVLTEVLDGIVVDVTNPAFNIEAVAGVTPVRTVDFDPSRPDFDHNTRRGFFGAMISKNIGTHTPFAYGLIQRDYNDKDFSTTPAPTRFEYNSYYFGVGSSGSLSDRLHYGVEFAYETGNSLSRSFTVGQTITPVPQKRDNIRAYALDARIDYLIPDTHQSRITLETLLASGDPDRGSTNTTPDGNRSGTDDNAFNSFGLINTGLSFGPAVSNLIVVRLGGSTFPLGGGSETLRRFQVGTDVFAFWKMQRNAPIDEATIDQTYLGFEPDFYVNWQLASDVTLALRYGIFFPNSTAFPRDDARQFVYAGVTFAY